MKFLVRHHAVESFLKKQLFYSGSRGFTVNSKPNQPATEAPLDGSHSDPVWRHSLREAKQILVIGAVFMVWTVGYSYFYGYSDDAHASLTFGIPTWAFWGIAVPWGIAALVSIVFATWLIEDDPLVDDSAASSDGGHCDN